MPVYGFRVEYTKSGNTDFAVAPGPSPVDALHTLREALLDVDCTVEQYSLSDILVEQFGGCAFLTTERGG